MQKRSACFWATPCGRGCTIRANYQSTTVHLPPALATGNLDIVTDAMVREVTMEARRQGDGVHLHRQKTGAEHHVKARVVVLAASALRVGAHPAELAAVRVANSSGKVGKYIMDTVGAGLGGQIPLLENMPPHNEDGAGGGHMYVPWWLYKEQHAGQARLRARLSHRIRRRSRRCPALGTASRTGMAERRQLRQAASRKTRGATTARSSTSPGAAR